VKKVEKIGNVSDFMMSDFDGFFFGITDS